MYTYPDQDYIIADVSLDDGYQSIGGMCFRKVTWMQRRPHLYRTFTEEEKIGSLE